MQYLRFDNTNMDVSRLCLGGMMFSRTMDAQATRLVIDEALDYGVNFIDTAESYTDSEDLIGRALERRRDKIYLATKVYTKRARDGRSARNSRANILLSLDRSLELLRTDYVDLFQLHHPDPDTPLDETLAALDQIVKQGKARHVGVSNHYAWQSAYMLAVARERHLAPIVSIQLRSTLRATMPTYAEVFGNHDPTAATNLAGEMRRDFDHGSASLFRFAATEPNKAAPSCI